MRPTTLPTTKSRPRLSIRELDTTLQRTKRLTFTPTTSDLYPPLDPRSNHRPYPRTEPNRTEPPPYDETGLGSDNEPGVRLPTRDTSTTRRLRLNDYDYEYEYDCDYGDHGDHDDLDDYHSTTTTMTTTATTTTATATTTRLPC
ncbi:hypothetical protein M426DRAFT_267188 [Hypoxylon sp. CI-4A]|nr:hypothetical protein M426DRAFT_267188 [Hypoxylon sp. CI-4A]